VVGCAKWSTPISWRPLDLADESRSTIGNFAAQLALSPVAGKGFAWTSIWLTLQTLGIPPANAYLYLRSTPRTRP
jgi:hypothetical protein